jgi:hypothetical protein
MTRFCLALALVCAAALAALPLWADTISISGTIVTMDEGESPVVAQITMRNLPVNGPRDEKPVALTLPHLTVNAMFGYGDGLVADDLIVTPPDGTYCEPRSCVLRVEEGDTGTLRLMEWVGG